MKMRLKHKAPTAGNTGKAMDCGRCQLIRTVPIISGQRFRPAQILKEMVKSGKKFYEE